jgi:hypothetical protein
MPRVNTPARNPGFVGHLTARRRFTGWSMNANSVAQMMGTTNGVSVRKSSPPSTAMVPSAKARV